MASTLPTNIAAQTTGHPALHNAVNAAVNEHDSRITSLEGRATALEGVAQIVGAGRPDIPASMTKTVQAQVAAAPVGATFTSTDGASVGAWEWQKLPTSWIVTNGDTGWLDLTSMIQNGWTASNFKINRINRFVELRWQNLTSTNATDSVICALPRRFNPGDWLEFIVNPGSTASQCIEVAENTIRAANRAIPSPAISGAPGGVRYAGALWSTPDDWPTTLTGTAA